MHFFFYILQIVYYSKIDLISVSCIKWHIVYIIKCCTVDFCVWLHKFKTLFQLFDIITIWLFKNNIIFIYIRVIYLNVSVALIPLDISHGLPLRVSGHGSINISNTSHLVSEEYLKIKILEIKLIKMYWRINNFSHLLLHMRKLLICSVFTETENINPITIAVNTKRDILCAVMLYDHKQ